MWWDYVHTVCWLCCVTCVVERRHEVMRKHGKEVENDSRRLLSICMGNDFRIMKPVLSTKSSTSSRRDANAEMYKPPLTIYLVVKAI